MSEPTYEDGDDLRYRAMLYAAGEMNPAAAVAFEGMLINDELAQQALVEAVQLFSLFNSPANPPLSGYRERVRKATIRPPFWVKLLPSRYRWRPREFVSLVCGCVAGITFAMLCIYFVGNEQRLGECDPPPFESAQVEPVGGIASANNDEDWFGAADDEDAMGMAEMWAELSNDGEHLHKVIDDQNRRRTRWHPEDLKGGRRGDALSQPD